MTHTDHPGGPRTGDRAWAVLLTADRYEAERLVHHDTLELTGLDADARPAPGDPVAVLVDGEAPTLVALGRIARTAGSPRPTAGTAEAPPTAGAVGTEQDPDAPGPVDGAGPLLVAYTRRAFDEPVPAAGLTLDGPVTPLPADRWRELADRLGPPPQRRSWLVSLDLPIEAASRAEAVRLFWSYVRELGPRELPAYVSPIGDELAMQAFVLGAEANQDPEEDD